jgi:hypothetical protein
LEEPIFENIDWQDVLNFSTYHLQFEYESDEFSDYYILSSYGNVLPKLCESQNLDACINEIEKEIYELTPPTSQNNATFQNEKR